MEQQEDIRTVDNRVFLIGLDYLFRHYQKIYETQVLLPITNSLVEELKIHVPNVPVEGYYGETPELTKYFLNSRALQKVPADIAGNIKDQEGYLIIKKYIESSLFGVCNNANLLPTCTDPLTMVLAQTYPDWSVVNITSKAFSFAKDELDPSLVGLACLTKDPVIITALRESVVLYANDVQGAVMRKITYMWKVDNLIVERANMLIDTFNTITGYDLPKCAEENAGKYYHAAQENRIINRCVKIGRNENGTKFYHWAIDRDSDGELVVRDFWDTKIWTTDEYKEKKANK